MLDGPVPQSDGRRHSERRSQILGRSDGAGGFAEGEVADCGRVVARKQTESIASILKARSGDPLGLPPGSEAEIIRFSPRRARRNDFAIRKCSFYFPVRTFVRVTLLETSRSACQQQIRCCFVSPKSDYAVSVAWDSRRSSGVAKLSAHRYRQDGDPTILLRINEFGGLPESVLPASTSTQKNASLKWLFLPRFVPKLRLDLPVQIRV